jgi:hypothetical protein
VIAVVVASRRGSIIQSRIIPVVVLIRMERRAQLGMRIFLEEGQERVIRFHDKSFLKHYSYSLEMSIYISRKMQLSVYLAGMFIASKIESKPTSPRRFFFDSVSEPSICFLFPAASLPP